VDRDRVWVGLAAAAVPAYFRAGGITDADGRRADADALALCRSGAIPSLTLVATP
jgi:putative drug exporter of the RND superfamily